MAHNVRQIVERELSEMDWSNGIPKHTLVHHFRMAPTIREMFENRLPDRTFSSEQDLMQALPESAWQDAENVIEHGTPESHYLQSLAAKSSDWGQTPGFGRLPPEQGQTRGPS
jgi:hypothetical protein